MKKVRWTFFPGDASKLFYKKNKVWVGNFFPICFHILNTWYTLYIYMNVEKWYDVNTLLSCILLLICHPLRFYSIFSSRVSAFQVARIFWGEVVGREELSSLRIWSAWTALRQIQSIRTFKPTKKQQSRVSFETEVSQQRSGQSIGYPIQINNNNPIQSCQLLQSNS